MIILQSYITKENLPLLTLCHPTTVKNFHMDTQTSKGTTQTTEVLHQIYSTKHVVSGSGVSIFQFMNLLVSCKILDLRGPTIFKLKCEVLLRLQSWYLAAEKDCISASSLLLSPVYWCHPRISRSFSGRMLPSHASKAWRTSIENEA